MTAGNSKENIPSQLPNKTRAKPNLHGCAKPRVCLPCVPQVFVARGKVGANGLLCAGLVSYQRCLFGGVPPASQTPDLEMNVWKRGLSLG